MYYYFSDYWIAGLVVWARCISSLLVEESSRLDGQWESRISLDYFSSDVVFSIRDRYVGDNKM